MLRVAVFYGVDQSAGAPALLTATDMRQTLDVGSTGAAPGAHDWARVQMAASIASPIAIQGDAGERMKVSYAASMASSGT